MICRSGAVPDPGPKPFVVGFVMGPDLSFHALVELRPGAAPRIEPRNPFSNRKPSAGA